MAKLADSAGFCTIDRASSNKCRRAGSVFKWSSSETSELALEPMGPVCLNKHRLGVDAWSDAIGNGMPWNLRKSVVLCGNDVSIRLRGKWGKGFWT